MSEERVESGKVVLVSHDVEKVKKDGSGTYTATVISYANNFGVKEKTILSNFLKVNKELAGKVSKLKTGDTVTFKSVKKGNYLNLLDITIGEEAAAVASKSPKTSGGFRPSNEVGMQVGNALTNATNLLVAGKGVDDDLEATAKHVLEVGESLKAFLLGGAKKETTVKSKSKPPVKKTKPVVEELDDDSDFFDEDK